MAPSWRIFCTACTLLAATLSTKFNLAVGVTLSQTEVRACPEQVISTTCTSNDGFDIGHRWTVIVPGYSQAQMDISNSGDETVSVTPDPNSGVVFQITRVFSFPLVSRISTRMSIALDRTEVECGADELSQRATFLIPDHPDTPKVMVTSEEFGRNNATITLQWTAMVGENYSVNVTPSGADVVMIHDATAQLTVSYNTRYNVSVIAMNCVKTSSSSIKLFYESCGPPTVNDNVVILNLPDARVVEGTRISFGCSPEQIYEPVGPTTATCNSFGLWEPNTTSLVCQVRAQLDNVTVLCTSTLECGNEIGEMTARQCCVENESGLAITLPDYDVCLVCIVFGFFQDSFTGVEQDSSHRVQAGYQKGAAQVEQNLVFDIVDTPITAREGSSFDYVLITRALFFRPTPPGNVTFTFRLDGIAQESNETLSLELVPTPTTTLPTGDHAVFFRRSIYVTIIDSDTVGIFFSGDNFNAVEAILNMPVMMTKDSPIAIPIVVDLIPLTVNETRERDPLLLQESIPPDNPFSPPFAYLDDFNSTVIRITFESDEEEPVNDRIINIAIVNDLVNEANESFIVHLQLIDSVNPGLIDLSRRPASLCRIIDDDFIRIGFELPEYTYVEPMSTSEDFGLVSDSPAHGPIFLAKEDNVTSEQTFLVLVQVSGAVPHPGIQPATLSADYFLSPTDPMATSLVIRFLPSQQRLNLPFTLIADMIAEGPEAFQARSSPETTDELPDGTIITVPSYQVPEDLLAQTFINIDDDEIIIIGIEQTNYTVSESSGTQDISVRVLMPTDDEPFTAEIAVVLETTFTGAADSADINAIIDRNFTFNNFTRKWSFNITIIDDILYENTEEFNLELKFSPFLVSPPSGVELLPNISTVDIIDDDEITIGFLNNSYSASASNGQLSIQVGVVSGSRQGEVLLNLSLGDWTQSGSGDVEDVYLQFALNSTVATIDILSFPVIDVFVFELTQSSFANISFPGAPIPRVTLSPDSVLITIDVVVIGFNDTTYYVNEGDGSVLLTVHIRGGTTQCMKGEWVVYFSTSSSLAQIQEDFGPTSANLTLDNASQQVNVNVSVVGDDLLEMNETFRAQIILVNVEDSNCVLLQPAVANVTILDDDLAVISFVPDKYAVIEGTDSSVSLTVNLVSGQLGRQVEVILRTSSSGTAKNGADFIRVSGSSERLIFGPGVSSQVTFIEIADDPLFEEEVENFTVTLSTDVPGLQLSNSIATVSIRDTDTITIGFPTTVYTVIENMNVVSLTVQVLNGMIGEDVTVHVRLITLSASAKSPSDYMELLTMLSFSSSATSQTVEVAINNDELLEVDEEFIVRIELVDLKDAGRVLLLPNVTSVLIRDDDTAEIGFSPSNYFVTEGVDDRANVTLALISGQLDREIVVFLDTQSGSADSGLDFNGFSDIQLTFNSNLSSHLVPINITTDGLFEDDTESFSVSLSTRRVVELQLRTSSINLRQIVCNDMESLNVFTVSNNSAVMNEEINIDLDRVILTQTREGITFSFVDNEISRLSMNPSVATVTILDNDTITIGFDETSYTVDEHEGNVNVNVEVKVGSLQRDVVISFSTIDITAVAGDDYEELTNHLLTFNSAATTVTVNVGITVTNNSRPEEDEVFQARISFYGEPIPRVTLDPDDATVAIFEIIGKVGFTSAQFNVKESDANVAITVGLISGKLRSEVELRFYTVTANTDKAIAGVDYAMTDVTLTLNSTQPNKTITISISDNNAFELMESFSVRTDFSGEPVPRVVLMPSTAKVIIFDDDVITIGFLVTNYSVDENTNAIIQIGVIEGSLQGEVLLNVSVVGLDAVDGKDFSMTTDSLVTLNAESPNKDVTISIFNDEEEELTESFVVDLSFHGDPLSSVTLSPSTATVAILDNDGFRVVNQDNVGTLVGGVVGSLLLFCIIGIVIVTSFYCYVTQSSHKKKKILTPEDREMSYSEAPTGFSVQSSFHLKLPPHLIIHSTNIKLIELIGQGEFGVVYRGHIIKTHAQVVVAIKTLKGFYDKTAVKQMLKECSKMEKFDHPNVLTIIGVCLDGGPAPFIIMPYMTNGSLLAYLRKNRGTLVVSYDNKETEEVSAAHKQLMDMSLQVARGMEYLAMMKVVHRDLASRNCMIGANFSIKVADFGLAESIGTKDYFRQDKSDVVKLPLKWLAPESMEEFMFSEKSDVWAYGVTCWEIFSGGKIPYASVDVVNLPQKLINGYRLEKPVNDACTNDMYTFMLQCWEVESANRPAFSDIVVSLTHLLSTMADYMEMGADGTTVLSNPTTTSAVHPKAVNEPAYPDSLEEDHCLCDRRESQQPMLATLDETIL